jgi:hypothetical protein
MVSMAEFVNDIFTRGSSILGRFDVDQYHKLCAQGLRSFKAWDALGISFAGHPGAAKDYDKFLKSKPNDFTKVYTGTYNEELIKQLGPGYVVVFGAVAGHPNGHIEFTTGPFQYKGRTCYAASDTLQTGVSSNRSAYANGRITIFKVNKLEGYGEVVIPSSTNVNVPATAYGGGRRQIPQSNSIIQSFIQSAITFADTPQDQDDTEARTVSKENEREERQEMIKRLPVENLEVIDRVRKRLRAHSTSSSS